MNGLILLGIACAPPVGEVPKDGDALDGSGASIVLESPIEGAGTYDGAMEVAWTVTGLTLDPAALGGAPVAGQGHVHVYVDGELFEESATGGARINDLREGDHTVLVRLAGNDHQELDAQDTVAIAAAFPTVRLASPPDGATLTQSSTDLAVAIDGFTLRDPIGSEDRFGEGYFTVSIDGVARDWGADPTLAMATGLTEGGHVLRIELVTNDGRPLDPPSYAESRVEVLPGSRGVYFDRAAFVATFDSATLPLALSTTAFTLVDGDDTLPAVDGEGHLHLYMDGAWLDRTVALSHVLQNIPAGDHSFEARLVSNDGYELPVLDRLRVRVAPDRPDALITYPGDGWSMGASFDLSFEAENFALDASTMGGPNAPDVGHAQVYLDGVLFQETAANVVPLRGLTVGTHAVRVQLANNDGTAVSPPVYNEIAVIVE